MGIMGTDDYLIIPDVDDKTEEIEQKTEFVLNAIFDVYSRLIAEREARGDFYTGMSRNDYVKMRKPGYPTRYYIEYLFGGWDKVSDLLYDKGAYSDRRKLPEEKTSAFFLYDIICTIAEENDIKPRKVKIRQYDEFRRRFSPGTIPVWRAFARRLVGEDKWKKMIWFVCNLFVSTEYEYRKVDEEYLSLLEKEDQLD